MKELVFVESSSIAAVPFTTSEIIAEFSENSRDSVMRLIRKYTEDLEEFGIIGFEIRKPLTGSQGGRPLKSIISTRSRQLCLSRTWTIPHRYGTSKKS